MLAYVIRRVLQGILVIFLVSVATFGILQMAPGSPIDIMVGEANVTQEQIEAIEAKWGLDKPWYVQYVIWLGNMARGDFGTSVIRTGVPVSKMVREAAPVTLKLNFFAFVLSTVIAVPIGIVAAVKRYSVFDYISMVGMTMGIAMPAFWVGLMAIIIFSLKLDLLPSSGSGGWQYYVLPVAVLATDQTALIARLARGSTLEVLRQDFVTTARAKGLSERVVLVGHVVRNAMLPVVTVLGYRLAFLLSGTIVVETVFAWPGIGRLFLDSIFRLDYQVIQAIVLLLSILVVAMNILTDLLYAYIDPRIRIK
ncbi:MAG TPA: ABC transporter permease [Thermomicrobiales bacterium]|nr:ABC transporter permease [Thermomicrobiales bacterium]